MNTMSIICKILFLGCLLCCLFLGRCAYESGDYASVGDDGDINFPEAPPAPEFDVAIWRAGSYQGDFGFDLCQNFLDSTGGTSDGERIGEWLKQGGYTRAVFFGSTSEYSMGNLHSDPDALGGDPDIANYNVGTVTTSGGNFRTRIEFQWEVIPLIDFSRSTVSLGARFYDNDRIGALLREAGLGTNNNFYTFTAINHSYATAPSAHCSNSSSNLSSISGSEGQLFLDPVTGQNELSIFVGQVNCDTSRRVFCIGRR